MKTIKILILTVVSVLYFNGCGDEVKTSPIQIKPKILVAQNFLGNLVRVPIVEIFAIVDNIKIKDVIANNGNCKMTAIRKKDFPATLKYGQKATAGFTTRCNLLKVEVITDQGNWTQEFSYIPEEYINN